MARSLLALALVVLAVLAAVGASYFVWKQAPSEPRPAPAHHEPSREVRKTPELAVPAPAYEDTEVRPVARPTTSPDPDAGHLQLPNGEFVPTLNGVKSKDRLKWGPDPFPGIAGKIHCKQEKIDWYLLKNGDVLTTVSRPGTDHLGREVMRDLIVRIQKKDVVSVFHNGQLIKPGK